MAERDLTHDDVEAAIGTPQETSVKLDHTLQAYGRLERRYYDLKRDLARVREERDEARERANRYERLVARYRSPMVDGGLTLREKVHTAKVRMDDAEALAARYREALEEAADFLNAAGYLKAAGRARAVLGPEPEAEAK